AAAASTLVGTTADGTATGCLTTRTVGTTPPGTSTCLWILCLRIPSYQVLRAIRTAPTLMEDMTGVLTLTSQSACSPGSNMSTSMWIASTKVKAATTLPSAREDAQKSPRSEERRVGKG